jgi:hypothetical protein
MFAARPPSSSTATYISAGEHRDCPAVSRAQPQPPPAALAATGTPHWQARRPHALAVPATALTGRGPPATSARGPPGYSATSTGGPRSPHHHSPAAWPAGNISKQPAGLLRRLRRRAEEPAPPLAVRVARRQYQQTARRVTPPPPPAGRGARTTTHRPRGPGGPRAPAGPDPHRKHRP